MPSAQGALRAPDIIQREIDYQTKKSVHINLTKSTHSDLRIILLKKGVSMQEMFNRIASMVCDQNPYMTKIIDDIQTEKREKQIKQVTRADSESIFELIETVNPFEIVEDTSDNE